MHRGFVHVTGGRAGTKFRGQPLILLTTTGRKTGKDRTWPLVGLPIDPGDHTLGWVVAGSNGGHDAHPAWYVNLRADPVATVQDRATKTKVQARDASDVERDEFWPKFVETLTTYAEYQEATDRRIPVVMLEPLEV